MRAPIGRTEFRTQKSTRVQLVHMEGSNPPETAVAENLTEHGARVLTSMRWASGAEVLFKALDHGFQSRARVIYCQHVGTDTFAIGLELFPKAKGASGR